ncbi:hypothetical protein PF003_g29820 [Phytophthora fragariae]|nr:hypothetical protein PF003_g29820 [Phytophthora fragariae]
MAANMLLAEFNAALRTLTQFAVSDTTASARKVSKLCEDALPTDCHVHVLNLYLQYAIGIRENKETVSMYDPKTGAKTRNKRYCTIGGEFKKGWLLINAVRDLNNHISTDQRCKGLEDLFQQSIVNYSAFQGFFKKRGEEGDEYVFINLMHADWKLMSEMEAIVGSFADLTRAEVQRNDLVASELIVLLKSTEERLYMYCNEFMVYDIASPQFTTTMVASFPRFSVPVAHLSDLGQRCLARLRGQVEKRLAKANPETVMILLLDPRTKFSVEALIRPTKTHADVRADEANDDSDLIRDIIAACTKLLTDAHREVFCAMNAQPLGGRLLEITGSY